MSDLIIRGLRHLNFILCAICVLAGGADIVTCFRHNRWILLTDGILLIVAGVILFFNACKLEEK